MKILKAAVAIFLLTLPALASAEATLSVSELKYDFGYTPQHAHVTHKFVLKSTGDETVRISRIVPGCACTKAPIDKDVLEPGDSTIMEMTFNSFKYTGLTERTPKLYSVGKNDTAEVEHIITFRSNVVTRPDSTFPVVVYPYKLDMTPTANFERDKIKFTVTNVSDKDLTLTMVAALDDIATIELPSMVKAKGTVDGSVTLKKEALGMDLEKSFTFMVNDDSQSRYTVPIKRFPSLKVGATADTQESEEESH